MTRALLTLYELDRPKLQQLSAELEQVLLDDDRAGLARLLELGETLAAQLDEPERAVDLFLLPETDRRTAPLFASLRRISKKRALTQVMTSSSPALEARLRAFEPLRDDRPTAALVDKLLEPRRLPWYLRRPGSTGGWLDGDGRAALARGMAALAPALTPELCELADALQALDADAVLHDGL